MNLSRPLIRVVRSSLQFRSQNCLFRCLSWNALKLSRPLVRVVKSSLQFRCQKLSISMSSISLSNFFVFHFPEPFQFWEPNSFNHWEPKLPWNAVNRSRPVVRVVKSSLQFRCQKLSISLFILERVEIFTSVGSSRKINSAISLFAVKNCLFRCRQFSCPIFLEIIFQSHFNFGSQIRSTIGSLIYLGTR